MSLNQCQILSHISTLPSKLPTGPPAKMLHGKVPWFLASLLFCSLCFPLLAHLLPSLISGPFSETAHMLLLYNTSLVSHEEMLCFKPEFPQHFVCNFLLAFIIIFLITWVIFIYFISLWISNIDSVKSRYIYVSIYIMYHISYIYIYIYV